MPKSRKRSRDGDDDTPHHSPQRSPNRNKRNQARFTLDADSQTQSSPLQRQSTGLTPQKKASRRASIGPTKPSSPSTPPGAPTPAEDSPNIFVSPLSPLGESSPEPIRNTSTPEDQRRPPLAALRRPSRRSASPSLPPSPSPSPSPSRSGPTGTPRSTATTSAARPSNSPRSASDPTPLQHSREYADIDESIVKLITKRFKTKMLGDGSGKVYVLSAWHNDRPIIKIGHTTDPVSVRITDIKKNCSIRIEDVSIDNYPWTWYFYKHIESLAHAEAKYHRYNFECSCGVWHREYFELDRERGDSIVRRWIRFFDQNPYIVLKASKKSCLAELKPEWSDCLKRFMKSLHDDRQGTHDGGDRGVTARWDRFVDDSSQNRDKYHVRRVWNYLHDPYKRWKICSVLLSIYVMLLTTWSPARWIMIVVWFAAAQGDWVSRLWTAVAAGWRLWTVRQAKMPGNTQLKDVWLERPGEEDCETPDQLLVDGLAERDTGYDNGNDGEESESAAERERSDVNMSNCGGEDDGEDDEDDGEDGKDDSEDGRDDGEDGRDDGENDGENDGEDDGESENEEDDRKIFSMPGAYNESQAG